MITAIVKATILADKKDELRRIADILQYEYSHKETGCLQYESFIDGETFITIECWENQDVLDIHLAQEHVKKYVPLMKACIENSLFNVQFIRGGEFSFIQI